MQQIPSTCLLSHATYNAVNCLAAHADAKLAPRSTMANALPQIKVTNSRIAEGQFPEVSPVLSSFVEGNGVTKDGRPKVGNATECKVIRSRQSRPIRRLRLQGTLYEYRAEIANAVAKHVPWRMGRASPINSYATCQTLTSNLLLQMQAGTCRRPSILYRMYVQPTMIINHYTNF